MACLTTFHVYFAAPLRYVLTREYTHRRFRTVTRRSVIIMHATAAPNPAPSYFQRIAVALCDVPSHPQNPHACRQRDLAVLAIAADADSRIHELERTAAAQAWPPGHIRNRNHAVAAWSPLDVFLVGRFERTSAEGLRAMALQSSGCTTEDGGVLAFLIPPDMTRVEGNAVVVTDLPAETVQELAPSYIATRTSHLERWKYCGSGQVHRSGEDAIRTAEILEARPLPPPCYQPVETAGPEPTRSTAPAEQLDANCDAILKCLRQHFHRNGDDGQFSGTTALAIADAVDICERQAKFALGRLMDLGLVQELNRPGLAPRYKITAAGLG